MIMVDANNGIKPMTKEHIFLCATLKIPFIIVVTKIDICKDRQNILKETLQSINKFLNYPGIRRIPLQIKTKDDIILCSKNIYSESVTPIFKISCVTEEGIDDLKLFFNIISKKPTISNELNNEIVEYHIDHIFNVHGFGTVLGGHLVKGTINIGDKLLIGPHSGSYDNVTIRSIYCKKIPLQKVTHGSYVCLGIKKADKNNIKRGNVIICNKNDKLMVKRFVAEISILRTHSTTVRVGYEPVLNAYSIRQASKIIEIVEKQNLRKCEAEDGCLRNGDVAKVILEFKYHHEFLREGTRFILSEGKTKIVGQVIGY
jgi:GTPase